MACGGKGGARVFRIAVTGSKAVQVFSSQLLAAMGVAHVPSLFESLAEWVCWSVKLLSSDGGYRV